TPNHTSQSLCNVLKVNFETTSSKDIHAAFSLSSIEFLNAVSDIIPSLIPVINS
ncbi:hypothetical protein L9F63_002808, partial [Diploptera punctata]